MLVQEFLFSPVPQFFFFWKYKNKVGQCRFMFVVVVLLSFQLSHQHEHTSLCGVSDTLKSLAFSHPSSNSNYSNNLKLMNISLQDQMALKWTTDNIKIWPHSCCSGPPLPVDGRTCQEIEELSCYKYHPPVILHAGYVASFYVPLKHFLIFLVTNPLKRLLSHLLQKQLLDSSIKHRSSLDSYLLAVTIKTSSDVAHLKFGENESTGKF